MRDQRNQPLDEVVFRLRNGFSVCCDHNTFVAAQKKLKELQDQEYFAPHLLLEDSPCRDNGDSGNEQEKERTGTKGTDGRRTENTTTGS